MKNPIQVIPVINLAFAFIPVIAVIVIHYLWSQGYKSSIYAVSRMLVQLLMIGYFCHIYLIQIVVWSS
jgi:putative ABC transport system permease protein